MENSKELTLIQPGEPIGVSIFTNTEQFELAQRVAKVFSTSDMVPAHFKKPGNCMIALNLASRMGLDPFMVMQNMYIIKGRPGIEAKLAIALINNLGKFSPLQYKFNEERTSCIAYAKLITTGDRYEGIAVTLEMAHKEGWSTKSGSKWKTLPELMLQYRSAVFFARVYCPEALLGIYTKDELVDIDNSKDAKNVTPETPAIEEPDIPDAVIEEPVAGIEVVESWYEFVARKQLSDGEVKELENYIADSAKSLGMDAETLKENAVKAGDLYDMLEAVMAGKKDEPANEPAKTNWWDSAKHWSFREKDALKDLILFGFGEFSKGTKARIDNPKAYNMLKTALPETKKALVKKYDKMFGAGEFNKLIGK
jgi:hypothetical protein